MKDLIVPIVLFLLCAVMIAYLLTFIPGTQREKVSEPIHDTKCVQIKPTVRATQKTWDSIFESLRRMDSVQDDNIRMLEDLNRSLHECNNKLDQLR